MATQKPTTVMTKKEELLKIYGIYVATITAQEQRRYQVVAVYSALVAGAWAVLVAGGMSHQTLIIIGICVISLVWVFTVRAFKRLADAKFSVIRDIEKEFSIQPFRQEWEYEKNNKFCSLRLSRLDEAVPWILFASAFIYQVAHCLTA